MLAESLSCFPSVASHGAALAARTHDAEADAVDGRNAKVVPIPKHANRHKPFVVGGTSLWWRGHVGGF